MYDDILGPIHIEIEEDTKDYIGFCMDTYDKETCEDCFSVEECLEMNRKDKQKAKVNENIEYVWGNK